jgi:hypothetical protein
MWNLYGKKSKKVKKVTKIHLVLAKRESVTQIEALNVDFFQSFF